MISKKQKLYIAKSKESAEKEVRRVRRMCKKISSVLSDVAESRRELYKHRRLLAMLAAEGPCFHNPLTVYEVKNLRDAILRDECRLQPDGKPLVIEPAEPGKGEG